LLKIKQTMRVGRKRIICGDSEGTFSVFESSCQLLLPVSPLKR